jgi:hypothetical protein
MENTEFIPKKNEAGKYGYKDADGKVVIPFEYDTPLQ